MAEQVIKRGERNYTVRVFTGRDPDTGKRRYLNKTVRGTRRQAEQELTAMLRAKDTGTLLEPVKMSLNTLLDKWLESAAGPRVRERTVREYAGLAARYIRPELGERQLTHVKPVDIQSFYGGLLSRGLSATTIRHCHAVLHNAFEQAIRWQLTSHNPTQHVDLPRREHSEMYAMSEAESQRFLAAAKSDPSHALFALLLGTGLRPSAAAGLQWQDFDPLSKRLSVRRTVVRPKGGGWKFEEPKTRRGKRTLTLSDGLITALLEYRESAPFSEHDLMFPATNGEPLDMKRP